MPASFIVLITNFYSNFAIAYFGLPFTLKYFSKFDKIHQNFSYFLHWFLPAVLVVSILLPKQSKTKTMASDEKLKVSEKKD